MLLRATTNVSYIIYSDSDTAATNTDSVSYLYWVNLPLGRHCPKGGRVKKYDWFDIAIGVTVCIIFPVMIPVMLGIVLWASLSASNKLNKEEE